MLHSIKYGQNSSNMSVIRELKWTKELLCDGQDTLFISHLSDGSRLTVLHRLTGYGIFDTETSYRDPFGKFWLASGNQDIRRYPELTVEQAIEWVKTHANTCIGE